MKRRILVIDGGKNAGLDAALQNAGYGSIQAASLRAALSAAEGTRFDLALLDASALEAGETDAISLLRAKCDCPLLAIAPAGDRDGLVGLLEAGAEDYLMRPFELRELVERIEIQCARFAGRRPGAALRHRELTLNRDTFDAELRGQPIRLTKQEFRILELMLLSPPGRVFSKHDFFEYAWGQECFAGMDKTINVHICNIRKKLRSVTQEAYIETVWGLGFRLV